MRYAQNTYYTTVLVSVLQRERERERLIYLKQLDALMEAWQVQNLMGEGSRLETQERVAVQVQRQSAGRNPSSPGMSAFCSYKVFN